MLSPDFRRVLEALKAGVAIAEPDGSIAFANLAFAELVEREPRSLEGAALEALFAPDDAKRIRQGLGRVADAKSAALSFEARLAGAEPERWLQLALQPLDAREKAQGVVAVLQDIGAQRESEHAMQVLAARLVALSEVSPVPALIENAEGEIEMVNQAFLTLLGVEGAPQSFTGLGAESILGRAKGARGTLAREPIVVEGRIAGAIWSPRRDGAEPGKGTAEVALVERVASELSVALEGIAAIANRAQQMEFDPVLVDHFQRIRRATENAMAAIGDLVDFSNVSGHIVLRKADFALRPLLAALAGRLLPLAEEHDGRLRIKVEQDVPAIVSGDAERLEVVLRNLVSSAFALLPGAEITLQVTPEYTTESGIQLSFAVVFSDSSGTAPATMAAVEAGMGIAVAKFMVAAMGGRLELAPHPSEGDPIYGFTIEFPVRPAPAPPERAHLVSLVATPVLIVSGDPEQRLALANLLRASRMIPLEADNAPMAMALLERMKREGNPIPLVIVTNRLAGQDGFLLAFRIRHHAELSDTILVMLATEGRPGDAIACRENGISAYMRYPINGRQLGDAIAAVTGIAATAHAEATATLVTRHSLRETRPGLTVLLVDPDPDTQILATHILGRNDCRVAVARDLDEAMAALEQDMYDLVFVDTTLEGLGNADVPRMLRARIAREPERTRLVAITRDATPDFHAAKTAAGFDATLRKPFRRDDVVGLLDTVRRTSATVE